MVGIVLVSHSHRIAEGAAELARQMGGEDARIETAGGLDTPEHEIGTDAVLVQQAIERAWSDDGVLVLMDLGSAVLSAEMAVDLLPEDVDRSKVRLVEAPFVEGAVAAAVTARIGASLDEVAEEARGGLASKAAHLGVEAAPSATAAPDAGSAGGAEVSLELVVGIEHGLHARPAAAFVRTASSYDADVQIRDLTAARGPVSARSLNAVATLGVRRGDRIRVTASGGQANEAIDAVRALAERDFDEAPPPASPPTSPAAAADEPGDAGSRGRLKGLAASPGFAVGPAVWFHAATIKVPDTAAGDPVDERRAFEHAIVAARTDIQRQRSAVAARAGANDAAIFGAHLLLVGDDALLDPARAAIEAGATAAQAWQRAVEDMAGRWEAIDDPYQRARAADVRSVGTQVLARILGIEPPRPRMERAGVLVAADLAPADAAALDPATALGVAIAFGGPTSHAALLARSLGIPAVVGLGDRVLEVTEGTRLAIDGDAGALVVDPAPEVALGFETRRRERESEARAARLEARHQASTRDGLAVEVAANIGAPADVAPAIEAGCDGVGLFRTEFLFLDRPQLPGEDEQEAAYRAAAVALGGRPMLIRTLDVGADKPLPSVPQPPEANPFLGVRGIRLGFERPELLDAQLRAIVRVSAEHPVRVMFPMISTLDELRRGREAVGRAVAEVAARGLPVPDRVEVGVMIEVPSAALLADRLAEEADFFSIGTNDLTQYVFAAERGNDRVASLADPFHPAVLTLIARTCEAAGAHGRWAGVCGELAGDPLATGLLLGLGVIELSMSAPAIAFVKRAVRATDLETARALARRALEASSGDEVRALLSEP